MYLFAKELWGPQGGFLSAVAYIFAPYPMLDLYAGGSCAESASFAFLPLILLAFLKLSKDLKPFYLSVASISVAGLCLTHNCSTLIFCPVVFFYILILHFPPRRQNFLSLSINLITFTLGVGLAAFFWLPAMIEKKFIHTEWLLNGNLDFHNHFLSIQQLIYSSWPKFPGTIPFHIGPVHCLLAFISICFVKRIIRDRQNLIKPLLFLVFILILSIFLTLSSSLMIWEHIPILRFIQFPWRLIIVITLIVSIFIGGITLLSHPYHRMTMMCLGLLAIFLMNFSHCYPPYGSKNVNLTNIEPSFIFHNLLPQDGLEYMPLWVKEIRTPIPSEKLEIIKGKGLVLNRSGAYDTHLLFSVETTSPAILCFNTFYFPGWSITVDGHLVEIFKDNPFGLMFFAINESGIHEIKIDFGSTPIRRAAGIISIMSFIILTGLLFLKLNVERPKT